MTLHAASPWPGLAWEDPPPVEADPCRALEAAVRAARAVSHERKLEPAIAHAFAALTDALGRVVDVARVQERELEALKGALRRIEGVTFGDP